MNVMVLLDSLFLWFLGICQFCKIFPFKRALDWIFISAHLWLLEDGHEDKEAADNEEDDGKDNVHLDRPLKVGLFPSVEFKELQRKGSLAEVYLR